MSPVNSGTDTGRIGIFTNRIDSASIVALSTVITLLFGLIYSRFYFTRLSLPYRSLELSPAFFMMRSLTPYFLAFVYLVIQLPLIGILFRWSAAEDVAAFAMRMSKERKSRMGRLLVRYAIDYIPAIVALLVVLVFLSASGYTYMLRIAAVAQTLPLVVFVAAQWGLEVAGVTVARKRSRWLRGIVLPSMLVVAIGAAVWSGDREAEMVIEGRSPGSLMISFQRDGHSHLFRNEYVLILKYENSYFVTPRNENAPEQPRILVIPEDEMNWIIVSRP